MRTFTAWLPILLVGVLTNGCSKSATQQPLAASRSATSASATIGSGDFTFATPVRLASAAGPVSVEAPGYASPCWADIDQDGKKDLLVGQFNGGKIRVYKNLGKNLGDLELAIGEWLTAGGKVAEVPGVW